jgi:hypothetical protein
VSIVTFNIPEHREAAQRIWKLFARREIDLDSVGVTLFVGTSLLPDLKLLENDTVRLRVGDLEFTVRRSKASDPLFAALEGRPVEVNDKLSLVFGEQVVPKVVRLDADCVSFSWDDPPTVCCDNLPEFLGPSLTRIELYETHAYLVLSSIFRVKLTW